MVSDTKKILLLGSGFVAGPCLTHLLKRPENNVTVACRRIESAQSMIKGLSRATAIALDVTQETSLDQAISDHDVVISLIPYTQHALVIASAIKHKKHFVSTSYVSPTMAAFDQAAKDAGVIIMNEIGLDPGIDHLYAVKMIKQVHEAGGKIVKFISYCGGLPAPEASNNPLGYKFSWSSRGVLLALRNSAKYIDQGQVVDIPGPKLMDSAKPIHIYPAFAFEGYPNRDSTHYRELYHIPEAQTVLRGTLRYQGFPKFVKALVKLGFLSDEPLSYLATDAAPIHWNQVTKKVLNAANDSESELKSTVLARISFPSEDIDNIIRGLKWLGIFSSIPVTRRGNLLDSLCALLEEKMSYAPGERDMVMLQHKFEILLPTGPQVRTSTGLWFGVPHGPSAMATTVGVPCAIATQLILDGKITKTGVLAPMDWEIVEPLLQALEKEGIFMTEEIL